MHFTTAGEILTFLFALTSQHAFGKRLVNGKFFTRCLVGLSLTAALVGALANVATGLIRPVVIISLVVGALINLGDLYVQRSDWKKRVPRALPFIFLIGLGVLFFALNNPNHRIFTQTPAGEKFVRYDKHFTYYSIQSQEMLEGTYLSRIRIANLYPVEWTRYHFFNSAAQAVLMGLIPRPTLMTQSSVRVLIAVLILLSFGELFFAIERPWPAMAGLYLLWLMLGFSPLSNVIPWNFVTSGAFSVFAIVHLLYSLLKNRNRDAVVFALILGISVARLLPFAFLLLAGLAWINRESIKNLSVDLKKNLSVAIFGLISAIYCFLTLVVKSYLPVSEGLSFEPNWLKDLGGFNFMGYFLNPLGQRFRNDTFTQFNRNNLFSEHPYSALRVLSVLILVGYLVCFVLKRIELKDPRSRARLLKIGAAFVLIEIISAPISITLLKLNLLFLPYLFVTWVAIRPLVKEPSAPRSILAFLFAQAAGLPILYYLQELSQGPAAGIIFDASAWAYIGWQLLTPRPLAKSGFTLLVVAVIAVFYRPPSIAGIIMENGFDNTQIEVSELFAPDFRREDFVDKDNVGTFHFTDPRKNDLVSGLLGCRYLKQPGSDKFESFVFAEPESHPTNSQPKAP